MENRGADLGGGSKAKTKARLISSKREMNVGIALSALPRSVMDNLESLIGTMEISDGVLDAEVVHSLILCLPTKDEAMKVANWHGHISALSKVEGFFKRLESMPRAGERLKCMQVISAFGAIQTGLHARMGVIASTIDRVRGSRRLRVLLRVILKLGNKLNSSGGDANAVVQAFTVASLMKLCETKSFDQKKSFLDIVESIVATKLPEVMSFANDFPNVGAAAKITDEVLESEIRQLSSSVRRVESEVQLMGDSAPAAAKSFLQSATKSLEELKMAFISTKDGYARLLEYFGEDPDLPRTEFLGGLEKFTRVLGVAHERNSARRARERRAAANRERVLASKVNNKKKRASSVSKKKEEDAESGDPPVQRRSSHPLEMPHSAEDRVDTAQETMSSDATPSEHVPSGVEAGMLASKAEEIDPIRAFFAS